MKRIFFAAITASALCAFAAAEEITVPHRDDASSAPPVAMKVATAAEWDGLVKRVESLEAAMVYLKPLAEMRRKARETAAEKSKREMEERLQTIRASEATRRKLERKQGLMDGAKPRIRQQRNHSKTK